jgi:hypothetical protein
LVNYKRDGIKQNDKHKASDIMRGRAMAGVLEARRALNALGLTNQEDNINIGLR